MDICRTFARFGHCEIVGCLYKHPNRDDQMIMPNTVPPYANSYGITSNSISSTNNHTTNTVKYDSHDGMTSASSWEEAGNYQPYQDGLGQQQPTQHLYNNSNYKTAYSSTAMQSKGVGAPFHQPMPHQNMGLVSPPQMLPYGGQVSTSPYPGVVPYQSPPTYTRKLCRFAEKCRNGDDCPFYHPKPHEQQFYQQQQQQQADLMYRSPPIISPYQQGYPTYQPHPAAMQYSGQTYYYGANGSGGRGVYLNEQQQQQQQQQQPQPQQSGASHHQSHHPQSHHHHQQTSQSTHSQTSEQNITQSSDSNGGTYISMTADQLIKGTIPSPTSVVQQPNPVQPSPSSLSTTSSSTTTPSSTPPAILNTNNNSNTNNNTNNNNTQTTNTPVTNATPSNNTNSQPNQNGNNHRNNKQKNHHHQSQQESKDGSLRLVNGKSNNYTGPKPNYIPSNTSTQQPVSNENSDKVIESMATAIKQIHLKDDKQNGPNKNETINANPSPTAPAALATPQAIQTPSPLPPHQRKGPYQSPSFDKKNFKTISKPKQHNQYDDRNNSNTVNGQSPHNSNGKSNDNGKIKKDINNGLQPQNNNNNNNFQKKRNSFPPLPRQVNDQKTSS